MISWTDEYTIALGIVAVAAYVVSKFAVPPSLVHPLLLGKQAHVAQVRSENESAVYRNYGIGASQLPTAPGRGVTNILHLLKLDSENATKERWLWNKKITNQQLNTKIKTIGAALCSTAKLVPHSSRVLLLLNDSLEWLIADLALASQSVPTITLSSSTLLNAVIEAHPPNAIIVQATFLTNLLELLTEASHDCVVIVVGDRTGEVRRYASRVPVRLVTWEDIEASNAKGPEPSSPNPQDIVNAHFYKLDAEGLHGAQYSHQNIVAGVASLNHIFSLNHQVNEKDTLVSAHGLATPFGRSLAYTALYSGANFATLPSADTLQLEGAAPDLGEIIRSAEHDGPSPTILFITPRHLGLITSSVLTLSKRSWLFPVAWRHKQAYLLQGYLSNESVWDRYVFESARTAALGKLPASLRIVAVSGAPLDNAATLPARIALSVPVLNAYVHPLSASPIFCSHPHDFQIFDEDGEEDGSKDDSLPSRAHSGAPVCNIEVKLLEIDEKAALSAKDLNGSLCVRGPTVGEPIPMGIQLDEGWIRIGEKASVRANGTFVV